MACSCIKNHIKELGSITDCLMRQTKELEIESRGLKEVVERILAKYKTGTYKRPLRAKQILDIWKNR